LVAFFYNLTFVYDRGNWICF